MHLLLCAVSTACLPFFHLGHAKRKCGTVSVIPGSYLSVSAMLILLRYVLSLHMFVLSWTSKVTAVLLSALYITTMSFSGNALSIFRRCLLEVSAYYCTPKCLFFDLSTMVFAFAYLPQHFGFGLV
jgi:hypothetical protein